MIFADLPPHHPLPQHDFGSQAHKTRVQIISAHRHQNQGSDPKSCWGRGWWGGRSTKIVRNVAYDSEGSSHKISRPSGNLFVEKMNKNLNSLLFFDFWKFVSESNFGGYDMMSGSDLRKPPCYFPFWNKGGAFLKGL